MRANARALPSSSSFPSVRLDIEMFLRHWIRETTGLEWGRHRASDEQKTDEAFDLHA